MGAGARASELQENNSPTPLVSLGCSPFPPQMHAESMCFRHPPARPPPGSRFRAYVRTYSVRR